MPVKFDITKEAQKHIKLAIKWLQKTSDVNTARDVIKGRINDFKTQLTSLPESGKECLYMDDDHYRELIKGQYRFIYKIESLGDSFEITIITFCHTKMNYQTILAQTPEYMS
jgi:plasmid stabilization system protein ParE